MKVPSITIEVGPRRHLNSEAVEIAFAAVWRTLHYHKMLPKPPEKTLSFPNGIWRRVSGPRSVCEGLVLPVSAVGNRLTEGEVIAEIIDKDGLLQQKIVATETCVILAFPDKGYIASGQTVCTLAVVE